MNILIAPDKFKGSLSAQQVCDAVAEGIRSKHASWPIIKSPMADGGEGTVEILTAISRGQMVKCKARDPLFREIESGYGLSADGKTAFIEMAKASGLQLLKESERGPMITSTVGTGDLIAHALMNGVEKIILGCGGSATNDGGIGMASALGIIFLDVDGKELKPTGESLLKIHSILTGNKNPGISKCNFVLLSDVNNPLTGISGAAFVFAKQKGASDKDIFSLDEGLKNFANVLNNLNFTSFPGAGAAGGFPVSAKAFLNAEIQSGIKFIMGFSKIEEKIRDADLIITGEGKFDQQSLNGKVVTGLSDLCAKHNKPLWIICGINEVAEPDFQKLGIRKVISLVKEDSEREKATQHASEWIKKRIKENI